MKFNLLPKKMGNALPEPFILFGRKNSLLLSIKKNPLPFSVMHYATVTAIYCGVPYGSGTTTT